MCIMPQSLLNAERSLIKKVQGLGCLLSSQGRLPTTKRPWFGLLLARGMAGSLASCNKSQQSHPAPLLGGTYVCMQQGR